MPHQWKRQRFYFENPPTFKCLICGSQVRNYRSGEPEADLKISVGYPGQMLTCDEYVIWKVNGA